MTFDLTLVKKHPIATGAIVLVGAVLVYLALKKRSAASSSAQSSAAPDLSSESMFLGVQTAGSIQNAQINAQLTAAQLGAQVAVAQTNAQLSAVQASVEAAQQIEQVKAAGAVQLQEAQNSGQVQLAQISAGVQSKALDTQLLMSQDTNATNLAIEQVHSNTSIENTRTMADYGSHVADLQASVAIQGQNDYLEAIKGQQELQLAAITNTKDLQESILDTLAAHGKLGGSSTGVTQIISAIYGQGPAALANTNPAAYGGGFNISIPGIGSLGVQGG